MYDSDRTEEEDLLGKKRVGRVEEKADILGLWIRWNMFCWER